MLATDGPLTPRETAAIRAALDAHMKSAGLSQSDVAKAVGQSSTYISNLLTSAASLPVETRDALWRDIANWLEREARAKDRQAPAQFVRTTVAERFIGICERLIERADMAVVYGPAGVGKSISAEAAASLIADAVLVRVDRTNRTQAAFIQSLMRGMTRRRWAGTPSEAFRALCDRLRRPERVKARSLLIIDQAHELHPNVVKLLMDLHDVAKCSILLVGTIRLRDIAGTNSDLHFGQLSSRIGMRVNLAPELTEGRGGTLVTAAEIRKMFERGKLKLHPATARILAKIAHQVGSLRRVDRLVHWAGIAAEEAHAETITTEHLAQAQAMVEEEIDIAADLEEATAAASAG
jgi:hypothetical protein